MTLPVTVDPRYHDAVVFNLDAVLTDIDGVPVLESTVNLARKLLDVGSPRRSTRCTRAVNSF